MKVNAFGRAIAITFLYIAVFVLLVVVQFPSAGSIGAVAGGVSFKGLPGPDGKGLRSAEISASGIRLVFSNRHPLRLLGDSGTERSAVPVSYTAKNDGFIIRFNDNSTFSVSSPPEGRASWTLKPGASCAEASIRFELAYGATLLAQGDDGTVRLSFNGSTYRIPGISTGDKANTLTVSAVKGTIRPFVAALEAENKPTAPAQFIAQAPMDPAAWAREISDWRDKAWTGLSGPSFNAAAGTWKKDAASAAAFDEASFIAYEAEAMRRDRRDEAAALVGVVRASHAAKLSWKSATFAGKTAATMTAFEDANLAAVKATERVVQARSVEMFSKRGTIPLLFDRAPYSLAQEAMTLAKTIDFARTDALEAIGLIEAFIDARAYLSDDENPFARAYELVDKAIVPAMHKVDGAFYLQTASDGRCDALSGLYAGEALIRLADAVGKPIYAGIGQSLIVGFLRLSADDGSMPESVSIANAIATPSAERISAAAAYPIIADCPYYPRAVSFYKTLGPGAWAWTSAPVFNVDSSPEKTVFTAEYPIGSSHYIALYGVKPFAKIQLYGLNYNMDAGFESYNASGYFYKNAAGAMYLKMRHKAKSEDIRLFY